MQDECLNNCAMGAGSKDIILSGRRYITCFRSLSFSTLMVGNFTLRPIVHVLLYLTCFFFPQVPHLHQSDDELDSATGSGDDQDSEIQDLRNSVSGKEHWPLRL